MSNLQKEIILVGFGNPLIKRKVSFATYSFITKSRNANYSLKRKVRKLEKAFRDKPEVIKKIKHLNDLALETEKVLK